MEKSNQFNPAGFYDVKADLKSRLNQKKFT